MRGARARGREERDDAERGGGRRDETTRARRGARATSDGARARGVGLVTVWCEKGLVTFYESCGYVYEPAKGRRYAEDDEAVLRATRDSVRDARGISTGG